MDAVPNGLSPRPLMVMMSPLTPLFGNTFVNEGDLGRT
jgi:hypothetical protein